MRRVHFLCMTLISWLALVACTSPLPKRTLPIIPPQPLPTFTSALTDSAWQVWHVSLFPKAIYSLARQDDRLWVGTEYGIWQIDLKAKRIVQHNEQLGLMHLVLPLENDQVWAVGYKGVFFYDGQRWSPVALPNKALSAYRPYIHMFAIDRIGDLWIQTDDAWHRGLSFYRYRGHNPTQDTLEVYTDAQGQYSFTEPGNCEQLPTLADIYGRSYHSTQECRMLQLARQAIIKSSPNNGFLVLDTDGSVWGVDYMGGRVTHWWSDTSESIELPAGSRVQALAPAPTHGVWIGTDRGLFYAVGTELQELPELDHYFTLGHPIDLDVEPSGTVWTLTAESALNWLPADHSAQQFEIIPSIGARAMAAIPGGVWITHGNDLIRIKLGDPPAASVHPPEVADCKLDRLTVDRTGDVWSTTHCGIVWQYQLQTQHWIRHTLTKGPGTEPDPIQQLLTSADGTVYAIGLSGFGEMTQAGEVITTTALPYLAEQHHALFPSASFIADRPDLFRDSQSAADGQGGLWFAIAGQPDLWHYAQGQVSQLAHPLQGQAVNQLYVDRNGRLWEVGNDQQLAVYDGHFWRTVAMPDLSTVKRIVDDPTGRLWFLGQAGLAVYDPKLDRQP